MKFLYMLAIIGMLLSSNVALAAHTKKTKSHKLVTHQLRTPIHKIAQPAAIYGINQLVAQLNAIISENSSGADVAVYVRSMRHGQDLYARNIYQPLTPASTLKVFTAEAALLYLGPEYRFSTQLLTDSKNIKNGILQGNLYVVLSGDPSLTYYDLMDLALTLRSQQIQAVAGNVYIDNTAYDQSFYGPGWILKDKQYCYAAPISASIINHNCVSLSLTPAKVQGHVAQVNTSPKYFYPAIRNSIITKSARGCSVHLSTDPGNILTLDGCMPKGKTYGVSYVITDVPEYNRALFKNLLSHLGVSVFGSVTFASAGDNLSLVGQHASKPLRLLVNDMLKKSDNIIAGALFKKIGELYSNRPGSWENGSYAVSQILSRQAGVNTRGMKILDGSGLSPDNLITPSQMMQVLDFAYHHYSTSYEFISALPIAGIDGTLKNRMSNIARRVRAKTGTISGVISLAGYAETADKEPLAFVIMVNGKKNDSWKYREMEDEIATALTRYR